MLPKHQKLTGKEINYMLKRGKRLYAEHFTFWVIDQYSNISYNQRGIQIPVKVAKNASMRNFLKRAAYDLIDGNLNLNKNVKVFAVVNKKKAEYLIDHIATSNKKIILGVRKEQFSKDLRILKTYR